MSTNNYTTAPPSYQSTHNAKYSDVEAAEPFEPLLGSPRAGSSGAIYNQPAVGDVPDDFKVSFCPLTFFLIPLKIFCQYGTTVSESSLEIRNAFVRKVYTILCKRLS